MISIADRIRASLAELEIDLDADLIAPAERADAVDVEVHEAGVQAVNPQVVGVEKVEDLEEGGSRGFADDECLLRPRSEGPAVRN